MREMILAKDVEGRKEALAKMLPYQLEDFKGILHFYAWAAGDHPSSGSHLHTNLFLTI